MRTSIRALWFNCKAMPLCVYDLNPGASAVTRYCVLRGNRGIRNDPSAAVEVLLMNPVSSSLTVIWATTDAPDGSVTVPRIVAVFCCENIGNVSTDSTATQQTHALL